MKYYFITIITILITTFFNSGCDNDSGFKKGAEIDIRRPAVTCSDIDVSIGFHVTVDGTSSGDGSLENPWDLNTAFRNPSSVKPGDTIWVHGGTYKGTYVVKLDGEENNPITVSAWPGDRVTIDSEGSGEAVLQIFHKWAVIRGIEITNSSIDRRNSRPTGIWAGGDHISLQNLVVHDVGVGISGGQLAENVQQGNFIELYGCLFYNNGWLGDDRGHGHHIYLTNRDSKMDISHNLIFSAYGSGVHVYSETDKNYVQGFDFTENVWFLNGAPGKKLVDGCLVGHNGSLPVNDIVLKHNFGWATGLGGRNVRLGWGAPTNYDAILEDNYFVGLTIFQQDWSRVTLTNNEFIGELQGVSPDKYPDNSYITEALTQNRIFIVPNRYEPGRAFIVVYNWENLDEVKIDPSEIMSPQDHFTVKNAEDFYGDTILEDDYSGGEIILPVTGLKVANPIGETEEIEWKTGKDFKVFILQAKVCK